MGGVVSGLLAPIGSFLGTCVGSCCAAGCCKLMTLGSTDTRRSATFLLVWLQAIAVLLALIAGTWNEWLKWPCDKLMAIQEFVQGGDSGSFVDLVLFHRHDTSKGPKPTPVGICAAVLASTPDQSSAESVEYQVVYRSEAAAVSVFLLILVLCVSGCGASAAKAYPLGKLIGMQILAVVLLFLPNYLFTAFGATAGVLSFFFLAAQSILCIDVAYSANEAIYKQAVAAHRSGDLPRSRAWKIGLIAGSVALVCLSAGFGYWLCTVYSEVAPRVVIPAMLIAMVLLVVSITDWCEHGSLFASAVYMANIAWLSYEALAGLEGPVLNHLAGVAVCALWLVIFACSTWCSSEQRTLPLASASADEEDVPITTLEFVKQSAVHAAASVYIASELAPYAGRATFVARVTALGVALALYAWSLVAPKVLANREF